MTDEEFFNRMRSKEWIGHLPGVWDGDLQGDFYATKEKFVFIRVKSPSYISPGMFFGAVGVLVEAGIHRAADNQNRDKQTQPKTLDEMVKMDKENYSISYADVKTVELHEHSVTIEYRDDKGKVVSFDIQLDKHRLFDSHGFGISSQNHLAMQNMMPKILPLIKACQTKNQP